MYKYLSERNRDSQLTSYINYWEECITLVLITQLLDDDKSTNELKLIVYENYLTTQIRSQLSLEIRSIVFSQSDQLSLERQFRA